MGPTKPPIQWLGWGSFLGHEGDHRPPTLDMEYIFRVNNYENEPGQCETSKLYRTNLMFWESVFVETAHK
jgi:hypothetical protein